MSRKKQLPTAREEEFFDQMLLDDESFGEEDMLSTFGQVADASIEHMKVACRLTNMIVKNHAGEKLSTHDILDIFRKASETILDCTPLKALFEKEKN
jgi:hypothetical protein